MDAKISVDKTFFWENGYLIFDGLLSPDICKRLESEIDSNEKQRTLPLVNDDAHSEVIIHPAIMSIVSQLMETENFRFHHLHSACHRSGMKSIGWHHDYEQIPQIDRDRLMVHVFLYLGGLNGTIGDLLVVPGSHKDVVDFRHYFNKSFTYFNNYVRINSLSKGSVVVVHSAITHARQERPGGEVSPRYFVDISYAHGLGNWACYLGRNDWGHVLKRLYADNKGGKYMQLFTENSFHTPLVRFVGSRIHNFCIPHLSRIRRLIKN